MVEKRMEREDEEEFELIPLSPIRRLEKRLEQLEKSKFDTKEFYKELVDIIRLNQEIVQEMAKANDALRIEISKLPGKLDALIVKLDELISFIRASATEEHVPESEEEKSESGGLSKKLEELLETNKKITEANQAIIAALENLERKLKRPPMLLPRKPLRKPLLSRKPI
jgi:molecular chaperone DnaK (HSP70)